MSAEIYFYVYELGGHEDCERYALSMITKGLEGYTFKEYPKNEIKDLGGALSTQISKLVKNRRIRKSDANRPIPVNWGKPSKSFLPNDGTVRDSIPSNKIKSFMSGLPSDLEVQLNY